MAESVVNNRKKSLLTRLIIFLVFATIGIVFIIIGFFKWYFFFLGLAIIILALVLWLVSRNKIKNITCPSCGKFYSYPKEVRVNVEGITHNYQKNTTIEDKYDRIEANSVTEYTGSDYDCTVYCHCSNCGAYSQFQKTFKTGNSSYDKLDDRVRSYFHR